MADAAAAALNAESVKTGVLLKRSRNRSALAVMTGVKWQDRNITVSETRIAYGNVGGPAKDFLPLNSKTTCYEWANDETKEFAFCISSGADELILNASSEEEKKAWMDAIDSVSGSSGDAVADAAADQIEALALSALSTPTMPSVSLSTPTMPSVSLSTFGGALSGAASSLLDAAGEAAKAAAELAMKEANAAAAKAAMQAKLRIPVACSKKTNTEFSYFDRYIWIDADKKEFFWGKTDDISKGKSISIATMVKSVSLDVAIKEPNFHIDLQNAESVFTSGVFSAAPTSIDITLTDSEVCAGFISYINELKA